MNFLVRRLRENRATTIVVTLLFVLAATIVWNLFGPHADARLEAIRRQGYPVNLAELNTWYQAVPDNQNNALIYEKVFALPNVGNFEDINWPARDQALSAWDKEKMREWVDAKQATLRLLHSAQVSNHCRYPVDLNQLFSKGPNRIQLIQDVQLLCAEAVLHADNGDSQQAARSFLAAGLLADSVAEEPLLISQIVRLACWNILVQRLDRALALTPMTDEQLASLQAVLAEAEKPQALLRGLAGERAMGIAIFTDPVSQYTEPESQLSGRLKARFMIGLSKSTGFFEKDRTFYFDVLERSVAAASLPFPERLNLGGRIPTRAAAARFSLVSPIILPRISSIFDSEANTAARLRAAQTALAVERFRRGHDGTLPATLQELVPAYCQAVPSDPFDGEPLRFKTLDSGCLIYGNGVDTRNGGPLGFRIIWRSDSSPGAVAPSSTAAADNRP